MKTVLERLTGNGTFRALVARIRDVRPPTAAFPPVGAPAHAPKAAGDEAVVVADGLWGSFAPFVAGSVCGELGRPLLYVTAHLDQADTARDDLELLTGRTPELLSAFETVTGEGAASDEIAAERIRLCAKLRRLQCGDTGAASDLMIVAPVQSLMQSVPSAEALAANLLTLTVGDRHDPRRIAEWLVAHGYTRLDQVESPGDFALRGDILDIFPPAETDPYRIDFFDDVVETIRRFDVSSQRSQETLDSVQVATVTAASTLAPSRGRGSRSKAEDAEAIASFLSYLPTNTLIVFDEPVEIQELGRTFWSRLNQPRGMMPVENLFRRASTFVQLHMFSIPGGTGAERERFSFGVQSLARFETKTSEALRELADLARQRDVLLFCDNEPEKQRFIELWDETVGDGTSAGDRLSSGSAVWERQDVGREPEHRQDAGATQGTGPTPGAAGTPKQRRHRLQLVVGLMHRGFDWPAGELAVVGHHEVFHRYQQRRKIRKSHAARPIESWLDLHPGDHVVHVVHGIGRFLGMKTLQRDAGRTEEFLTLEFADAAKIHVPVNQIDLVQKYIGAGGIAPHLTKIGGTRWIKTKERVEASVSDLAAELLRIQAARGSQPGIRYPDDTIWQREFEGAFIYTETEDQLAALDEIKRDMRRSQPMDRLLCGDVGYGKTELAIRGAFKAVEYGKQVAVLVPTTVLAEQHERTFRERMADFPFAIESLSRWKTNRQTKDVLDRVKRGQVDIVIGTHRLLSKDVAFKDLGLLVIDEEQRFGVEHKERLKRFRETVDVLTMSATPIPRTLHMSLLGIRDISSLATPPLDRRSIVTRVTRWEDQLIREAILREMGRDGQIYFVHNFVHDIQSFADRIAQLVPEARILIGHGQMREHELEKVMIKFIRHEADVLVCTTIIESGLDIPNCNTMLIDRADRFGLSELHQLRGRVGRYKHRAYCYLLLSRDKPVTPTAAKRLKAIEEYSDLGAGFRIAMRDLEIRGAGNILGPEQSGHIAAVGYELYCQLLDRAVKRLKNEPVDEFTPVHLELDVPAHLPRGYIDSDRQRMEIYRRLVRCRTREELEQLATDLQDAFGACPPPVQTLLDLAEIRILAQAYKIRTIQQKPPDLIFTVEELALVEPLFARSPGSARMADARTVHLRLSPAYFEPATLLAVLRRLLQPAEPASKIAAG